MDEKSLERLELNKILSVCAQYAVLGGGRERVLSLKPSSDLSEVRRRLDVTEECDKLLYTYGVGKIQEFGYLSDILNRALKGSSLSCGELLETAALLRSARVAYVGISKTEDDIVILKSLANRLYFDASLEEDIGTKIISPEAVADSASDALYNIRYKIRSLNDRIRSKLSEYVGGKDAEFLQDSIVTIRNDRYVIPVKAEYKSKVRGFVHDRSKTGATFFIEPEYVLELNNELISLQIDEREEVENILKALSARVGGLAEALISDIQILSEMDASFALAEYSYKLKCARPQVNDRGYINIIKGRHPLIDNKKVVPVSLELGKDYNFLLLSGANTGGKTVTLKMSGLFCLMAACGLFIPAAEGSSVAVFDSVFCDIGDSQSIEESLSTFSSHMENVINIVEKADGNSLVLIDELGGGTNPDEGQALAKSIVLHLLNKGCRGIVTTHFTALKEFAYTVEGIENASMEFDSNTLKPLYSIKIGLPGASNALAIAERLGMPKDILNGALNYLSDGARSFENVMRKAEESRVAAEESLKKVESERCEYKKKLSELNFKIEELNREREKISKNARSESRRIILDRTEKAEKLLGEIEGIFKKQNITESDLIAARTIKNKLIDCAFDGESDEKKVVDFEAATAENIKVGAQVYVVPMESRGQVLSLNHNKSEAEVLCGSIKMHLKLGDLKIVGGEIEPVQKVKFNKQIAREKPLLEINVLGLSVSEALYEVDNFIDRAVTDNLEEIKVIHGVGTGKLKNAIAEHLKKHKNVESFRLGKYGEGETGVTFIKLR